MRPALLSGVSARAAPIPNPPSRMLVPDDLDLRSSGLGNTIGLPSHIHRYPFAATKCPHCFVVGLMKGFQSNTGLTAHIGFEARLQSRKTKHGVLKWNTGHCRCPVNVVERSGRCRHLLRFDPRLETRTFWLLSIGRMIAIAVPSWIGARQHQPIGT